MINWKKSSDKQTDNNDDKVVDVIDDINNNDEININNIGDNGNVIELGNFSKKKKEKEKEKIKNHYCYILRNSHGNDVNRTYNGYTVNPKHRIRQHNQEIVGGAQYTKKWGNKSWEMYVLIKGFPDNHNALQCEWKIKHPARKRKRPQKYNGPEGRVIGLNEILKLSRWTSKSIYDNKDLDLEIWIQKGYETLLENIPNNVKINVVDKIDFDLV